MTVAAAYRVAQPAQRPRATAYTETVRSTVLYRKWRPDDFDSVAGQDAVVRTLRNAVGQDKIAHAYLFCGPRGTGKTTTARILARAINGIAPSAGALDGGNDALGFDLVEIDAASNRGIDDIRDLRERANYQPGSARFKVYLIDEVHQLTGAAADALLKTLEEPPPHVVFILATTDPEALKPTILSRCQRYDFRRVAVDDIVGRLRTIADAESIAISDDALRLIAREATGSLRDAVNLLDQLWTTCGDDISLDAAQEALGLSPDARALELVAAALRKDLSGGLAVLGAVQSDAIDFLRFKKQVVTHLRHILLLLTGAEGSLSLSQPEQDQLRKAGEGIEPGAAVASLRAFADADVRSDPYSPLPLELALAEIVYGPQREVVEVAAPAASAAAPKPERRSRQSQSQPRGQSRQSGRQPDRQSDQRRGQQGGDRREQRREQAREPRRASQPQQSAQSTQPAREASARAPADQLIEQIRDQLRSRREGMLATMLNQSCSVIEQTEDKLVLGFFPIYQAMHMERVRSDIDKVASAASAALGHTVTIECVPIDDANAAPPRAASSAASAPPVASAPESNSVSNPAPAAPADAPRAQSDTTVAEAPAEPSYSPLVEDALERFGARVVDS